MTLARRTTRIPIQARCGCGEVDFFGQGMTFHEPTLIQVSQVDGCDLFFKTVLLKGNIQWAERVPGESFPDDPSENLQFSERSADFRPENAAHSGGDSPWHGPDARDSTSPAAFLVAHRRNDTP